MKRYGSESYAQLEDIDNSFKVLRTQSIQTGIKQAKQVIRSLYDKARSVYVQESAKMYYNGCLEIGNKILAIKKPPKPNLPDYKASIEAANRTSEDLNAELSRFLAVHAKLLETENSIKHMQRRIENATDQIPLLKSDILRLISDLTTSQAEYLNLKLTHNALKKKIKIFKSNTSQTSNISIEIPEIPNFTNEKHGLEQETMIYEDNLTKYRNKLNFYSYLQNSINLVQSSIENISLNIKEYASESVKIINDIQELETNLVAKLNEVQSLENSVNIKENTKQTLYETHETTLMKLEDLLITKICIHKKHKNAYKKVQELEELKVLFI
jgi:chromosome segregation ATPase